MPTYTIKAPDGNTYSVQGPPNAPQEDVQAEVLRQHPEAAGQQQAAQQAPQQPQANPTDGMSTGDKLAAGVGKAFVDTGRGAMQAQSELGDSARNASLAAEGLPTNSAPSAQTQSITTNVAESRKLDKALMATNAGQAGELLGHMVIAASIPGGVGAQVLSGAAQGALTPTAGGESRAANAAVGGGLAGAGMLAGKLLGKIVGGVIQPFKNEMLASQNAAVDTLSSAGVPMSLAQQSGDKLAQTMSNIVGDNPLVGSSLNQTQQTAFTKAVLKTLGVQSDTADAKVLLGIRTQIGGTLDKMGQKYPIPMDDVLLNKLANIEAAADSELGPEAMSVVRKQTNNIIDHAAAGEGTIAGQAFANARSSLTRIQGQNDVAGHWAGEIHDALTDALQRNASPEDVQAIQHARTSWRILKNIEMPNVVQADDQINPSALYSALNRAKNTNAMLYGQGDASLQSVMDLGAAGKMILKNSTPNSGTPARVAGMMLMGASLGAIDKMAHGDPKEALEVGLLGAAGPVAAKMITQNPATAKFFAQWARSKVASSFRTVVDQQGKRMGALAGGSVVPSIGGSGITSSPDDQQDSGEPQ